MRWKGRRESANVEDRRHLSGGSVAAGGGALGIIIMLVVLFMGGKPQDAQRIAKQFGGGAKKAQVPRKVTPEEEELMKFCKVVFADTEDVWTEIFQKDKGAKYPLPGMVVFNEDTSTGCGTGSAAMGPFYCPADQKVYFSLAFFDDLRTKYKAPGDFAIAYVIAHEVAHHVQNQYGYTERVHGRRARLSKEEANRDSVRLELQADYLAGVWAHHAQKTKNILESGDIEEALGAAEAVGDDRLQKQARGYAEPESFTHGTSEQRAKWFRKGLRTGDVGGMEELFQIAYGDL